jgi:DnaA regulatory inactivator Hda
MSDVRQLAFDLPHRSAMGEADFLVAAPNAEAVAWIDRWPAWPAPALCLYGPAGCGKTHLARIWAERAGALWVKGADLAGADGAGADGVGADLPALAAAGALAVDDAAAVVGSAEAEEALFHLYNMLKEAGGWLLLSAVEPPARWGVVLPDLRSRLLAAPAVAVAQPDDQLLAAVLVKLFADRQVRVGADAVHFLLLRMERSFAAARRLVEEIDREALARRRPVTLPLIRRLLNAQTG